MAKRGLYANIHAKRKRIASGSGEKMRKPGSPGAPTAANFKRAAKTAKKPKKAWTIYKVTYVHPFRDAWHHTMERGCGTSE